MAITYTGTNGLFTRLGALVYMMDAVRTHQNNLKTLFDNIQGEYSAADRYMIDQLSGNIEQRQAEAGNVLLDIQAAAVKTLVEMLWVDAQTSSARTMRAKTIEQALIYLIRDMNATGNSVNGTTVGGGLLGRSGTGNGSMFFHLAAPNVLLTSTKDWPNIRTDLIVAQCIQDAQGGGVMPGSEVFQLSGKAAYGSLDWRFPAGSGVSMTIASACASVDNGPQYANVLCNSDLEDWTSNIPDQWTVQTGTAGAEFLKDTTTFWRGASSLKMAVTGNTFSIRQKLSSSDGTLGTIEPDRPYTLCFAAKKDASATGQIRVSIKDGANNIIGALTNTITVASGLTTSWDLYSIETRSPKVLAPELYLVIESTSAIASAAVYIDEVILAEMMPIAPGGPAFSIVAGSTNFVIEDRLLRKFQNNGEGAFVLAFDRLFDMYGLGLSLSQNYVGGESISDTLIA